MTAGDHPLLELLTRSGPMSAEVLRFAKASATRREIIDRSSLLARGMAGLGVRPRQRVALFLRNSPACVEALFACWALDAIAVPLNARLRPAELAWVLADARPALTLTEAATRPGLAPRLREALGSMAQPPLAALVDGPAAAGLLGLPDLEAAARGAADPAMRCDPPAPALMLYTSGTTSRPRGCLLGGGGTARNVRAMAERFRFGAADSLWSALPLYHVGGLYSFLAVIAGGGAWSSQAHFEPGPALALMQSARATFGYPMFSHIVQSLVEHPEFPATDLRSLRAFTHVGTEAVLRRSQAALPDAVQISAYGSTEAGGVAFGELDDPLDARVRTCGRPIGGVEVRIVDGELLVRGDGVLLAYHGRPEPATDADGWFHTGDRAELDAGGRLRYLGRLNEMLKIGGENVSPAEVEAVLSLHPAVHSAVVVGLPDPRLDEVPVAAIMLRNGASASPEALIAHCAASLAAYKVPRHVVLVKRWPMSATKIRRDAVARYVSRRLRPRA